LATKEKLTPIYFY